MTINKKLKGIVRERMALTGERYTTALKAVLAERAEAEERPDVQAKHPKSP